MKLALPSDLHLGEPVGRWAALRRAAGIHDTSHADRARRIVDALLRYPEPLHVAVLGDSTDRTTERELREMEEVLGAVEKENLSVVPGNHDCTSVWRMGMGYDPRAHDACRESVERLTGRGRFPFARDFGEWRLLCLDSAAHHESGTLFARGRIGTRQIAWLAAELADQRPTVVALHHYPAPVNATLAISDADDLLAVCNRDHVTLVNGHRHRAGVYPATHSRPRIITACSSVQTMRVRILDPVTGEWEWLHIK